MWFYVTVCMTTRAVNLQVVEKDNTAAIIEGISRQACETGVPKIIFWMKGKQVLTQNSQLVSQGKNYLKHHLS